MMTRNVARSSYLQRGRENQLVGGTEKSHPCPIVGENDSGEAIVRRTIGLSKALEQS
jgi:hypothetical protein